MSDNVQPISSLEARHTRRPDASTSIALALRCWLLYAFSSEETNRTHLQKGYHIALSAFRRSETHLPLLTLTAFIAIESGHFDSANEILDKAMSYKSFLRTHEPERFSELSFLYTCLEIGQKRVRSARKHWKNLRDSAASPTLNQQVMLGRLHLLTGEFDEAYALFSEAFSGGCRSPYLFEGLYRYYKAVPIVSKSAALLPVLCYVAARGGSINSIAANGQRALSAAIAAKPALGEQLYHISKYHPLLLDICTLRIKNNDKSREAYEYYLAAERKQLPVPDLYTYLVRAAYENNDDKINHYPMNQFLQTAEMDLGLSVYVYHLLLTDPTLADLLSGHTNKILQLAARCLEQGFTNREANGLYYYYWARCRVMGVISANLDVAEGILEKGLTQFELKTKPNSAVRFVYVTDGAKRGMEVYEMPEDGRLIIEAAGDEINYTCLGAGQRSVLDEALTVRRMVGGADFELYQYFFDKGDRRYYLLRYLADYYLNNTGLVHETESSYETAAAVLLTMLEQKNITKAYKMRLLLTLGQIRFEAGQYEEALKCYREVDENTPNLPRQLLEIYLHTRDYAAAAALIDRKHREIPANVLLETIIDLMPYEDCHAHLATAAHTLLTNGEGADLFDELLEITLAHFPFSQTERIALSHSLEAGEVPTPPALDKQILEGSLWMANPEIDAQRAFVRLQNHPPAAELLPPFTTLCVYHMLTADFRPEYDTLAVLEKYYLKTEPIDHLLALALGQIYLRYNISTFHSERIISDALAIQETNGFLLPTFKANKPAQIPFIEKNQPFLYRGLPGKDVYLYYKIEPGEAYEAKAMEYLQYGLYLTCLPLFYNEEIVYYFSEELPTGSITTREITHKNATPYLQKNVDPTADSFFIINNAIILEQMFKHDQVEALITNLVKDTTEVRSGLM